MARSTSFSMARSFRPIFWMGRLGPGRWFVPANFQYGSFQPRAVSAIVHKNFQSLSDILTEGFLYGETILATVSYFATYIHVTSNRYLPYFMFLALPF